MVRPFSTKLDDKVIRLLDRYCNQYHLKKTRVLEELISEGVQKKMATLKLVESIQNGLEDEREGNFYTSQAVEQEIFGKNKARR